MKEGALVIRILAILLQFGALSADNSTQYAMCHKNLTSSTGSVSNEEFSDLSCPEHEIRIQAGVPIVLTCQDLLLEVGSQQYCVSIGGIKKGKPRMLKLDDGLNNGGKRKPEGSQHTRSKRARALGKEQMAHRLITETERTQRRLEDLKRSDNQNMAKQKPSYRRRNDKRNKNKLDKLNSRLEKHTAKIGKLEKKLTKLQKKPNAGNQVSKLRTKLDGLKAKSEVLQKQIDDLQSILGTSLGLTNDTNGIGTTVGVISVISVIIDNQHGSDSYQTGNVNGDDSMGGDNSHDVSGHDSLEMDSGMQGDDSHENVGGYNYYNNNYDYKWPSMGIWSKPKNGDSKPQVLGKGSQRSFGKNGNGEGKGNGTDQSFCGPQGQPITVNSQTGEIRLSVRPKGPKRGNGRKPSKPHRGRRGKGSHGVDSQGPAGAAVVMIPSEVRYTCSWIPASP